MLRGDHSVRQNNPTALVAVRLACVSSALGLSGRAESSSPCTCFIFNVAGLTRTDTSASGAGTKVVFSVCQPSFWVLRWEPHFSNMRQVSSIIEHYIVAQNCAGSLQGQSQAWSQPAAARVAHHPSSRYLEPCKDPHTTILYRVNLYTRSPSLSFE